MQPYENLSAGDIMFKDLVVASPDQSLAELEKLLIDSKVSGVPVVEGGRLVGVVSRSDIVRAPVLMEVFDRVVTDAVDLYDNQGDAFEHKQHEPFAGFRSGIERMTIRSIMREQVVTCSPDTPVAKVADEMLRHRIHRVIVCQGDRPVGIISSLDIVGVVRKLLNHAGS